MVSYFSITSPSWFQLDVCSVVTLDKFVLHHSVCSACRSTDCECLQCTCHRHSEPRTYNVLHTSRVYRRTVGGVNQALRRNRRRPAKIRRYTIANGRWHIQLCWRACTMSLLLCIGLESHPKSCYLEWSFSCVSVPFRILSGAITWYPVTRRSFISETIAYISYLRRYAQLC